MQWNQELKWLNSYLQIYFKKNLEAEFVVEDELDSNDHPIEPFVIKFSSHIYRLEASEGELSFTVKFIRNARVEKSLQEIISQGDIWRGCPGIYLQIPKAALSYFPSVPASGTWIHSTLPVILKVVNRLRFEARDGSEYAIAELVAREIPSAVELL